MREGGFQLSEGSPLAAVFAPAEGSPTIRIEPNRPNYLVALLGCLVFVVLILGLRLLGLLEPLELAAYDALLQRRPAEATDSRILLVNITESDYNEFGQSIPDDALYRLLQKIDSYKPRVVGFDIYRNKPSGELASFLDKNSRVFGVAKINEQSSNFEIPPPPNMLRDARYGFADVPLDDSSKMVRRSYLYTTLNTQNILSFPVALTLGYLESQNISLGEAQGDEVSLAKVAGKQQEPIVALQRLTPNFGGYQNRKDFSKDYELLINYRVPMVAHEVTRAEVLAGKVDPAWIRDKVVLIGYQGESFADQFRVPYTDRNVPGFHIHAQVVSHLLSAALDGRKQIWVWSEPLEWLWIAAFGLAAGTLAWWLRSPMLVGLAILGLLVALVGSAFGVFVQVGWVPLVPPGLAVLGCASLVWALPNATERKTGSMAQIDSESQKQLTAGTDSSAWIRSERHERAQTELGTGFFRPGKVRSEPAVGDIGRYKILRHLDSGGMGDVYIATDTRINREVALKVLKARISEDMQDLKLRFLREVRVSAALSSFHIVHVSDFGITEEGAPYYVMELLHGRSLRQLLRAEKRLSVERTVRIAIQICEGLKLAHEGVDLIENGTHELVRVVHRDLKPENVFLVETGTGELVKLLDFGIAKVLSTEGNERTDLTRGGFLGTSRYASPEQWSGSYALDQRSDIYSLGMICYEMLSGNHPFGTPLEETMTRPAFWYEGHVNTPPTPLRARPDCQHVPEFLDRILMRCLAKEPTERLTTASQLQQALKDAFPNL
jgi:eukaryotic-like serine/threonine-protein kinase